MPNYCWLGCILSSLTGSPSLHFQLPLSMGSLRFSPIQNQCCSWSSDSLWATSSSTSSSPSSSPYHITSHLVRGAHPPKSLVEDLQNEVLLLGAADAQQVGSVSLAEQVSLQPAQLLLRLDEMKHLHMDNKGVFTVQTEFAVLLPPITALFKNTTPYLSNLQTYLFKSNMIVRLYKMLEYCDCIQPLAEVFKIPFYI